MFKFEWTDDMSIYVVEIDNHHKKLIEMTNDFYAAMKKETNREVLTQVLVKLIDYTEYHFSTEEDLMKSCNYPEIESHKQEHCNFVSYILDMCRLEMFNTEEEEIGWKILIFLKEWLTNHIMVSDKRIGEFLIEKGLRQFISYRKPTA